MDQNSIAPTETTFNHLDELLPPKIHLSPVPPDQKIRLYEIAHGRANDKADKVVCAGTKPAAEPVPDNLLALASKDAGWKGWGEIPYEGYKCLRSWMEEVHPGTSSRIMSYIIGLDSLKAISLEKLHLYATGMRRHSFENIWFI
ncbi:hypothetical protein Tco_0983089 [Tanacetum coccineum]